MDIKNQISENLLSKINGGVLDDFTKEEIRDAVDYFKASGVTLEFFLKNILSNYPDPEEAESYIRNYWEKGIV